MISKGGKWLIILYVVFLVILFLMCSTDLIIREPEREVYQIAVIIEDDRSDNYSNFRKGMDQAAMEFNVDVRFITLYEKADAGQQAELMEREQQDGVDAMIVVPADEEQAYGMQMNVPVIFLRPDAATAAGSGSIVIDYGKMGGLLAHEMLDKISADCPVVILTNPGKQSSVDRLFLEGVREILADNGRKTDMIIWDETDGLATVLEAAAAQEKVALLAENPEILTEAAGLLGDNAEASERVCGLYGRGNTVPILNALDRGQVAGICVTDDYSIGYFSVREAVKVLEGAHSAPITVESYYIEKEDLRKADFEKMLFPIE